MRVKLEQELHRWLADRARERVQRWRGDEDATPEPDVAARHVSLLRAEALEALDALPASDTDKDTIAAHLARLALEQRLSKLRSELAVRREDPVILNGTPTDPRVLVQRVLRGESQVEALDSSASWAARQTQRALGLAFKDAGPFLRGRHPDAGPETQALQESARAYLNESADIGEASLELLTSEAGEPGVAALRATWADGHCLRKKRIERLASLFEAEFAARALRERVKVERSHAELHPWPRFAIIEGGQDVRLSAGRELGLFSELATCASLGRALSLSMIHVASPPWYRWPLVGSSARAVGVAYALRLTRPDHHRALGASRSEAGRLGRASTALFVIASRLSALAVLAPTLSTGELPEEATKITNVEPLERLSVLMFRSPTGGRARFRGVLGGIALGTALRDSFDVDWHLNPGAEELIRPTVEPGGKSSIEAELTRLGIESQATTAVASLLDSWDGA